MIARIGVPICKYEKAKSAVTLLAIFRVTLIQ
jgi:hypothetical protein